MRFAGAIALLALAAPAPALAANADVQVGDDFFAPKTTKVQPGDSVTWRWVGAEDHSVRANAHQAEAFKSAVMSAGSFAHTFAEPGRFTYFCEIHPFMTGAVEVGAFVSGAKTKVSGHTAKISFRLSQQARVRLALSGPSKRVVRRLLGAGKRSITLRHLRPGRYRASLRPTDTAGTTGPTVKTKRFSVR
jgi:plastocyanin